MSCVKLCIRLRSMLLGALLSLSSSSMAADEALQPVDDALAPAVASVAVESPAAVQLPVDLKRAADIALEAFGGEVVKADEITDTSGMHFQIRLVNTGRVRDVLIDAANGEIISPKDEL